ncbi:hypothetical protein FQR65_LT18601 [Abscondita terminalis]|nr:hypothetical protein FQR65_LT18601 [Abscondita terminalis]
MPSWPSLHTPRYTAPPTPPKRHSPSPRSSDTEDEQEPTKAPRSPHNHNNPGNMQHDSLPDRTPVSRISRPKITKYTANLNIRQANSTHNEHALNQIKIEGRTTKKPTPWNQQTSPQDQNSHNVPLQLHKQSATPLQSSQTR